MAEPFKVHILGCGSALPTLRHHASSQVVEVREKVLMLDCSEGTQMQLRKCRVRFTKLSHVFITHLHGDHCFGLIGMISTFGLLGRTAKLHVHGPKALGAELERQTYSVTLNHICCQKKRQSCQFFLKCADFRAFYGNANPGTRDFAFPGPVGSVFRRLRRCSTEPGRRTSRHKCRRGGSPAPRECRIP